MPSDAKDIRRISTAAQNIERLAEAAYNHVGEDGNPDVLNVLTSSIEIWLHNAQEALQSIRYATLKNT